MEEKQKQKIKYLLAGLGLLFTLLLISSLGMWLVQEFLEHFDGRKYGEAVALIDHVWEQSFASEETDPLPAANVETDSEEGILESVLLDGNRLNDNERLQVLSELSLKPYESNYGAWLEREPIEEFEISETEAIDDALEFLNMLNSAIDALGQFPYEINGEPEMKFMADEIHPSFSLWAADLSGSCCNMHLYLDAKTGCPIRLYCDYSEDSESVNAASLGALFSFYIWSSNSPFFMEYLIPYLSVFMETSFLADPVVEMGTSTTRVNGYIVVNPVGQWVTDDYRYVLTVAFRPEKTAYVPEGRTKLDLVLSPMENQEAIRNELSERYEYRLSPADSEADTN